MYISRRTEDFFFACENFVRINESNFTYFRKSVPKISFRIRNANFRFIGANLRCGNRFPALFVRTSEIFRIIGARINESSLYM